MKFNKTILRNLIREQLEIVNVPSCSITEKFLREEISLKEYNKHLKQLETQLILVLEQEDSKIQQWFESNIVSKVVSFTNALSGKLKNLSASAARLVIKGIKGLLSLISKFKNKYPKLFKFTVALVLILFVVLFFGVVNAFGQDPSGMGYGPEDLDTMVGLLNMITDQAIDSGIGVGDIIEAKLYLQDLKDGVLDLTNYSQGAVDIASSAEEVFRDLKQETGSENVEVVSKALDILKSALDSGKETVVKAFGKSIDASGKPVI